MITTKTLRTIIKKREVDEITESKFWRIFSFPVTWVCVNIGIKADVITFTSMIVGLMSSVLFTFREPFILAAALLLRYFWNILDHADGELARFETNYLKHRHDAGGQYIDLVTHYLIDIPLHLFLGLGLFIENGGLFYLVLGFISCMGYGGWVRSAALSILFPHIKNDKTLLDSSEIDVLINAGKVSPRKEKSRSKFETVLNRVKKIRKLISYPNNIYLLSILTILDIVGLTFFNLPFTLLYLILQSALSISQILGGIIYFYMLLKKITITDD